MADIKEDVIDFGEIVNQIYRREMRRTFQFNLMLVGLSGIGKSSLVRSLFDGKIKPKEADGGPRLNEYWEVLEDNGVNLRLRCIETSNFRTHDPKVYLDYIEDKLQTYFVAQRRQSTSKIDDSRVHCCLYLIPPHGKMRLEDEDIECMKALHERVNLIPIIPKSEFYESSQKAKFKENILTDLKRHGINYFTFVFDEKEDEDRARIVKQEAERFPFAVVAADEPVVENNRSRWIRKTDSCIIDIYDKKYDFDALSGLLICHCMINLIDSTHVRHYANYKAQLLDRAQREGFKVLEEVGLNGREICRIKYETIMSTRSDRPTLQQLRQEREARTQELRNKLKELKARSSQQQAPPPKMQKPEITHPKPPILREKPEFLRARVSDLYRRT